MCGLIFLFVDIDGSLLQSFISVRCPSNGKFVLMKICLVFYWPVLSTYHRIAKED